ncbi:MAG TPA: acetate/propionate family kinase [Candidatus Angelobacter sp.]|nr:acetate/propionate family kinase [Candidatus Angelobacter sp.]
MRILVLNPGSSSLKGSLVEAPGDEVLVSDELDWGADATAHADRGAGVAQLIERLTASTAADAVGYRVVHGGGALRKPTLVDDGVIARIEALGAIAPLHNAVAAETIRAGRELLADLPHVACFDTAFHATLAEEAWRYPLPADWVEPHGLRRYGFHGLSVAWSVRRASELLDRPAAELGLVVAHLGSGCSVTAVANGSSVETSMGFTPLEGLMMGSRAGSVDPGILVHLLRAGVGVEELADGLDHRSGLLAASGGVGGARELTEAAIDGRPAAILALAMFTRRAAAGIAAAATALDRLDALVFTGGIGENSAAIRADITRRLAVLGIPEVPDEVGRDAVLSHRDASIAVLRIEAREDLVIAGEVADLLAASS